MGCIDGTIMDVDTSSSKTNSVATVWIPIISRYFESAALKPIPSFSLLYTGIKSFYPCPIIESQNTTVLYLVTLSIIL